MLLAQPQQKCTVYDELEGRDNVAPENTADYTLPTSTRPSVREDSPDIVSAADCGRSSSRLCNSHSTGHLSVNSDGSFMHIEGLASADDAECHEEAETTPEFVMPVDSSEPAAHNAVAQDANIVLDTLSEDMSEHGGEASVMHIKEESIEACFMDIVTCHC